MTMHHMQPQAVKSERIDPAFLPPSYHLQQQQLQLQQLQQQQLQQQQQQFRQMAPQGNTNPRLHQNSGHHGTGRKLDRQDSEDKQNIESLPDFPSITGKFGWTTIDNVNVPYILRHDKQFVSVRIVEMKLLSRYPNSYPDDLGKHAPLTSFFITVNEAKLLNEINLHHCAGEYGKKEFTTKDLIVLLTDFTRFYELVKKTFPDPKSAREFAEGSSAGWLQIKNTVTPFVTRPDGKYVPLSVIQYAAGLLVGNRIGSMPPTVKECDLLNKACQTAGVEFVFSESTRLIKASDISKVANVEMIELPNNNPLKHATYMELPTTSNPNGNEQQKVVSSKPQNGLTTSQPYRFQPSAQVDVIRNQLQDCVNGGNQGSKRHPGYPNPQVFDPRLGNMYRAPIPGISQQPMFLPPGQSNNRTSHLGNQIPPNMSVNPMMQYYLGMQNSNSLQKTSPQGPPNKVAPPQSLPGSLLNHADKNSRSSQSTSPRSRPPSIPRPPSGPQPPCASPLSPLSPSYQGRSPSYSMNQGNTSPLPVTSHANTSLQQIQNMLKLPGTSPPVTSVSLQNSGKPSGTNGTNSALTSPNANQEIPGLFSPTGSSVLPQSPVALVNKSPVVDNGVSHPKDIGAPPPLLLMSNPAAVKCKDPPTKQGEVPKSPDAPQSTPVPATETVPVRRLSGDSQPMPVALTKQQPAQDINVVKIKGAWLNSKSISCLHVDKENVGRYCLVEAVCKLYFNGCSVNEFLFALENVLNVPLRTCTDEEEKAFIQYYSLPVQFLKCNKMIKFDDLEKFFPQLAYMFPDKNAQDLALGQEDDLPVPDVNIEPDNNNVKLIAGKGLADLEAPMPVPVSEMSQKRNRNSIEEEPAIKRSKPTEGGNDFDGAVIVLD